VVAEFVRFTLDDGSEVLARCAVEDGWPLRRAAERFQVSHATAARWVGRYRQLGAAGMADLAKCVRTSLDCADICEATGRVLSRHTGYDVKLTRATLQACATASGPAPTSASGTPRCTNTAGSAREPAEVVSRAARS
jgi:hypothetical protein